MIWSIAIHVISSWFATFALILIQFSSSAITIKPAWTLSLNQLIAIIGFDSHFKSLCASLSFVNI